MNLALSLAESFGAKLHDFTILSVQDGQEISLHLEWDKNMKFNEAWKYSEKIKEGIKENYESVKALIEPSWKKMDVDTIFLRDNHRPGGVIVLEWSGDIKKEVSRLGFNIETGLQVEYLDSPAPLRDGYYRFGGHKNYGWR